MPALPKRPCDYPGGCDQLVEPGKGTRCPSHLIVHRSARKTAERGYGGDHRRLRVLCFERDHWQCVDCGWEPQCVHVCREAGLSQPPTAVILEELRIAYARKEQHLHADHEKPVEERPDLALDLGNYRTRCDRCHNAKTAREDGGFGNAGTILRQSLGPPAARAARLPRKPLPEGRSYRGIG